MHKHESAKNQGFEQHSFVYLQIEKNVLNLAATLAWTSNEIKYTISLYWTSAICRLMEMSILDQQVSAPVVK